MIGKRLAHYQIAEALGRGGMGELYVAEDTRLNRKVALKVLPAEMAGDPDRRGRFEREAKAIAALNHPNIVTIHSVEEAEGLHFLTMELVEGETLTRRIPEGGLPPDRFFRYAVPLAEGIAAAHDHGITHRDLKPDNIMVTAEGRVKILDFGLAKLADPVAEDDATMVVSDSATQEGRILGTVAYMSPEQAEGKAIDHRTDIFSLGIVLYEMISGCRPFQGDSNMSLIASILRDTPPPIVEGAGAVPEDLEAILLRCLEKDPAARYQSVAEVKADLERIAERFVSGDYSSAGISGLSTAPPARRKALPKGKIGALAAVAGIVLIAAIYFGFIDSGSDDAVAEDRTPIAVVDFANETGEKELDGLSGMLITALEQSRRLSVLTRSRMLDEAELLGHAEVERIDESLGREICRSASIQAMVIASVRRFGTLYSVDLKVLDTEKNEYIFTASEEGDGQESIPGMIDKLARATRGELKEKVASIQTASRGVAEMTTVSMEAYQHYFRGEELIHAQEFEQAIEEYQKAVDMDSTFALAWYRLAYAIGWSDEGLASEPLAMAVKLIDRIPEKEQYLVRAEVARIDSGFAQGVVVLRKMQEHYPDDKEMIFQIGDWLFHSGETDSSMVYLKRVLEVDQTHMRAIGHLAMAANRVGDPGEMRSAAQRLIEQDPSAQAYAFLADACRRTGDLEAAESAVEKGRLLEPWQESIALAMLNNMYERENFDGVEELFLPYLEKGDPESGLTPRFVDAILSNFYVERGRFNDLFAMLETSLERERAEGDTLYVAACLGNQALMKGMYGEDWDASKAALREIESMELETDSPRYWDKMHKLYVVDGQVDRAHEIVDQHMGGAKGFHISVDLFAMLVERDCTGADSVVVELSDKTSPKQMAGAYFEVARCMMEEGNYDRARWHLHQILTGYRESPFQVFFFGWSQYLLGIIHEETGEPGKAIEYYERFLARWEDADPDLEELLDARERLAALRRS